MATSNNENISVNNNSTELTTQAQAVPEKTAGETITADTYNSMLDVLENLATHNHIFYDDYTTVCECQCQCACSRGTL